MFKMVHYRKNNSNMKSKQLFLVILLGWCVSVSSMHKRIESDSSVVEINAYNKKLRQEERNQQKQARRELREQQKAQADFEMRQRDEHLDLAPILMKMVWCQVAELKIGQE